MKPMIVLTLILAVAGSAMCQTETPKAKTDSTPTKQMTQAPVEPKIVAKPSGVRIQDLVVGKGLEATDKMKVECHYTLWFADSTGLKKGQRFQSSKDNNGKPFTCTLGSGLIPGWSDGMIGMKEGGTRRIYIPWALGYGDQQFREIPPKTNLIFEIDFLKAVK